MSSGMPKMRAVATKTVLSRCFAEASDHVRDDVGLIFLALDPPGPDKDSFGNVELHFHGLSCSSSSRFGGNGDESRRCGVVALWSGSR